MQTPSCRPSEGVAAVEFQLWCPLGRNDLSCGFPESVGPPIIKISFQHSVLLPVELDSQESQVSKLSNSRARAPMIS